MRLRPNWGGPASAVHSRVTGPAWQTPRVRRWHYVSTAMGVVIAIDAGTTGVRCIAFDDDTGAHRGVAYRELTQHYPRPGWVEHDAIEIWEAVRSTLHELVATLPEPAAAIGITNQRETVVAWDRTSGKPYHRAIVWQDRRTVNRCDELTAAGYLPLVRQRT